MKRKIFSVLLIVSMLFVTMCVLTGCKNSNKEADTSTNDNSNGVQNNTSENAKGSERTMQNAEIASENYGDKVNYSVTVNGVELNDWRIFLKENGKVYIIYGSELPKEALPASIKNNTHIVKNENKISSLDRKEIIEALTSSANWKYLLNDNLTGKGASAVGSPTLEQFVTSYNAKYTNDKFNITVGEEMDDGYKGYSAKNELIVKDTKSNIHQPEGYIDAKLGREDETNAGTLYFLDASSDTKELRNYHYYWLGTPHSDEGGVHGGVCMVGGNGYVTGGAGITAATCRPIIEIPIDCLSQNTNGSWNIE